jgi:putative membrane protein insertion efficiency factor
LSRQTLGRDRRLLDRRALEQTLTTGQVARSRYFTLRYLRGDGPPEVAFVAGRKVGKAVRRNRARRVLREAFRTCGLELPGTATLVPLTGTLVLVVRAYQRLVSPLFPASCRYVPSCSEYAAQALARHGLVRGLWYAGRRLLRCHPWAEGGDDPVPR